MHRRDRRTERLAQPAVVRKDAGGLPLTVMCVMPNCPASRRRTSGRMLVSALMTGSFTTCTVRLTFPLVSAQTWRSWILVTPGIVSSASRTLARSMPSGTPSSKMLMLARRRDQVRGRTHRAISTATAESTHIQPVNRMTRAPSTTPREPNMSLQASRYAPRMFRFASFPPASILMLTRLTAIPMSATTSIPVDRTSGGDLRRRYASKPM